MPPCNTNRYIDSARARTQEGDMVCAAVFKHARIPIHAPPAIAMTAAIWVKSSIRPATNVIPANTTIAAPTSQSTDNFRRSRGKAMAPASAPTPKHPSNAPYPVGPVQGRARIGSNARRAIAATLNAPVRTSTARTSSEPRT